jgi:hypothetical protein
MQHDVVTSLHITPLLFIIKNIHTNTSTLSTDKNKWCHKGRYHRYIQEAFLRVIKKKTHIATKYMYKENKEEDHESAKTRHKKQSFTKMAR